MDPVRDACETCFPDHKDDCSGFVRAVGSKLGVVVAGLANDIVMTIRAGGTWTTLPDGAAAASSAKAGKLVLAGLRGDEQFEHSNHGHVAVVVDGPLAHARYPSAYWGKLGGTGAENETINWAWNTHDRDRVTYAACDIPAPRGG
ncbi:MAG TPA: hypothetical protein VL752_00380 [Acidisoma sp.]|uniref:hypothetical protein n=1 Tax=Acidisoma sp. TaxID=1872115 RepID=UPI002C80EB62|nr:hypothetical protein [Acidisoma sp.]HTH99372.1 hypothetical protein [Acidisoma sp.]